MLSRCPPPSECTHIAPLSYRALLLQQEVSKADGSQRTLAAQPTVESRLEHLETSQLAMSNKLDKILAGLETLQNQPLARQASPPPNRPMNMAQAAQVQMQPVRPRPGGSARPSPDVVMNAVRPAPPQNYATGPTSPPRGPSPGIGAPPVRGGAHGAPLGVGSSPARPGGALPPMGGTGTPPPRPRPGGPRPQPGAGAGAPPPPPR